MKIADMMEAYAQATGNRIMHHIGVAEVLVQLIESSRASRAEATEQRIMEAATQREAMAS